MNIVFDIDGVLADNRHRFKHIEQAPKNWDLYYDLMGADPVIQTNADLLSAMAMTESIFLCTGRPNKYRQRTKQWFEAADLWERIYRLFMRPDDCFLPNPDLKRQMAEKIIKEYGPIEAVFEDDPRSVAVWKEYANTVYEVHHVKR